MHIYLYLYLYKQEKQERHCRLKSFQDYLEWYQDSICRTILQHISKKSWTIVYMEIYTFFLEYKIRLNYFWFLSICKIYKLYSLLEDVHTDKYYIYNYEKQECFGYRICKIFYFDIRTIYKIIHHMEIGKAIFFGFNSLYSTFYIFW